MNGHERNPSSSVAITCLLLSGHRRRPALRCHLSEPSVVSLRFSATAAGHSQTIAKSCRSASFSKRSSAVSDSQSGRSCFARLSACRSRFFLSVHFPGAATVCRARCAAVGPAATRRHGRFYFSLRRVRNSGPRHSESLRTRKLRPGAARLARLAAVSHLHDVSVFLRADRRRFAPNRRESR